MLSRLSILHLILEIPSFIIYYADKSKKFWDKQKIHFQIYSGFKKLPRNNTNN